MKLSLTLTYAQIFANSLGQNSNLVARENSSDQNVLSAYNVSEIIVNANLVALWYCTASSLEGWDQYS